MAETIEDHEERLQVVEGTPAYGITATQISNWDNEVGAKALAETKLNTSTFTDYSNAHASDYTNKQIDDAIDADVKTAIDAEVIRANAAYDKAGAAADAQQAAINDAAGKYETIGTAQGIVDGLKLGETYEPIGAENRAKSYVDTELADFKTETVDPIAARVKAIEDTPYTIKSYVDTQDADILAQAKAYADGKEHKNTTYSVAATENALEFTVTPSEGEAQTVKLVAPVVDTGVMSVSAGNDIVVTPGENGSVTVAHEEFTTGAYTKNPADSDKTGDIYMMTGVTVDNGHVTGANVQSLAHALMGMSFILDGGTSAE
jgi:hypothetical protein